MALLRYTSNMQSRLISIPEVDSKDSPSSGRVDWMSSIDWLVECEARLEARIRQEQSAATRIPRKPADRRARRDAWQLVRRRIAELKAVNADSVIPIDR